MFTDVYVSLITALSKCFLQKMYFSISQYYWGWGIRKMLQMGI